MLTNAAGTEIKDFYFEIDEESQVLNTCSVTWENELYVFGGQFPKTKQIKKVTSCRLEVVGELAYGNYFGDCVNFANEKIVFCFNNIVGDFNKCRMVSSPTGAFTEMARSQHGHALTKIATDNGEFIIYIVFFNLYYLIYIFL